MAEKKTPVKKKKSKSKSSTQKKGSASMSKTETDTPSTDKIVNKILPKLKESLAPYLDKPESVYDGQIQNMKKLLNDPDSLPSGTVMSARESLKALEDARDRATSDSMSEIRQTVARAIVTALNDIDAGLVKEIKGQGQASSGSPKSGGGKTGRRGKNHDFILAHLKETGEAAAADIRSAAEAAGLNGSSLVQALPKLKEQGKIANDGKGKPYRLAAAE